MIDCHVHTTNSPDGESTTIDMINKGIEIGLDTIAFTDHCEVNMWYPKDHYKKTFDYDDYNYKDSFEHSIAEVSKLKAEYRQKIKILCGIELGQANMDFSLSEKILQDDRLDYVLGSIHQVAGFKDFFTIDYNSVDVESLLGAYFLTVLRLCKWGKFDVLAHLTYPLRYLAENNIDIDLSKHKPTIVKIFKTIISNNIGLEVNSSGLRQSYGKPFPTEECIRLYKELGGTIVSVGSDAHRTEDLGANIKDCIELIKSCGFDHLTYYVKRRPFNYSLD